MGKIVVLIPACNEATTIGFTVRAVLDTGIVDEVVVIDDGSNDKTSEVALNQGAKVIRNASRSGKGSALNVGIESVSEEDVSIIVFLDADLGYSASEVTKIIRPVLDGNADMCVGGFNKKAGDGGFGIVKKTAAKGIAMLTGCKFDWPLSGQRAMRMDCLEKIAPVASGFGVEVALTIDWMQAGFSIKEVLTDMTHRDLGRTFSGFFHRGIQFVNVVRVIAPRLVKRREAKRAG